MEAGKPRLGRFPQEDVVPYDNYWIAECLYRELSDDWSALALNAEDQLSPAAGWLFCRREIARMSHRSLVSSHALAHETFRVQLDL
ncbi:MAG: hypothetical protein EPO41_26180 [Reyranella sp.]|uniref:hypothetical protein n=1 Tax=Reyranella sp. TaxID=1929291 RepID=UPI001206A1E3|nr:hypothetical protein [Reyranella sp.]TAJ85504.1 MAG: hypothetical protein EPO41_26180 [Reyranella sp.]